MPRLPAWGATVEKVVRFGVAFDPELLDRFDAMIDEKGYANRSEAIRDLARKALVEFDIERAKADARRLNKFLEVLPISAKTGQGMADWYDWLVNSATEAAK